MCVHARLSAPPPPGMDGYVCRASEVLTLALSPIGKEKGPRTAHLGGTERMGPASALLVQQLQPSSLLDTQTCLHQFFLSLYFSE